MQLTTSSKTSSTIFERLFAVSESASASDSEPGPRDSRRPGSIFLAALVLALVAIAVTPATALAWTPGTHIFLGEAIIRSLSLLPSSVAGLLASYPYDFLYGSIAADTSIAKKYAAAGRHCHSWTVGMEIHAGAETDALRAFGLGYLAHLAADAVAHNYFVPHQLTITSSTAALGHSYWESRFDTHIGEKYSRRAREIILLDHSRSDEHLDRILSPTIFSTPTNRRIFRGMVFVADTESWQRVFQMVSDKSRWDLTSDAVGHYVARSFDFIVDLLQRFDKADPYSLDPAGTVALRDAKRIRRAALRHGGEDHVIAEAFRNYGLPISRLAFAEKLPQPLYEPAREASS